MKPEFPPYMPLPGLDPDGEFFWKAAHAGRLEMLRCKACGWIVHPARPVCSRCRARELAPHELSGRGRVVSWTVNHQRWMPGLEEPYAIAIVELAEQANLRLTTNLVDTPLDRIRIDMPVRVRFREVSDEIALPAGTPAEFLLNGNLRLYVVTCSKANEPAQLNHFSWRG